VFLTTLAIVDDIGAVVVIAVFYSDNIAVGSLLVGLGLVAISYGMNRLRVRSSVAYLVVGLGVWMAFLHAGVHVTIAAILMAFTIPARTWLDGEEFRTNIKGHLARLHEVGYPQNRALNSEVQQRLLDRIATTTSRASAPLSRLEHGLGPLVTFVVLPLFALTNAGVSFAGEVPVSLAGGVTLGAMVGLCLGKPLGVMVFAWMAVKTGLADLPQQVGFRQVFGAALLAGVGFTMALFIGHLAFAEVSLVDQAKVGVLLASVLSGIAGYLWLRFVGRGPTPAG
jgi:NhaA family Na+:H+ antiporter